MLTRLVVQKQETKICPSRATDLPCAASDQGWVLSEYHDDNSETGQWLCKMHKAYK